jgi:HD-like signal output (HDOD) protein/CheY-like chemotaxis protein
MMRVLFVDDEPNILSGLRRILRPLRDQWEMTFMTSGADALEFVAGTSCDVVVSDMKMPGMDGAEFLSRIREQHPESIRIALSGETDNFMIYRCVQHAHQYIAKPCDADTLISTVRRALALRDLTMDEDLKSLVSRLSTLPSLPEQYELIMHELQSEEPSLQKIASIIESDIAMTAKILQLVNSAFFGLVRQVSSASEAAMYLGLDVIRSLVLTTGVFSQFKDPPVRKESLQAIWSNSMYVATLAKNIAIRYGGDAQIVDNAYMGGMLTDIGKLILIANLPEKYAEIEDRAASGTMSYGDIEREVIGHSHTDIGAYLIGLWGLPNPVVECVAYHLQPGDCADDTLTAVAAVHIAHVIVHDKGNGTFEKLDRDYIERLGLAAKLPEFVALFEKQTGD